MNNFSGWIVDEEIGRKYLEKCKLFAENDDAFSNFRRDVDYIKILEGGERIVGELHLERINERGNIRFLLDNAKRFRENDVIGNPVCLDFSEINNINPCTIMYVSQLTDIMFLLGNYKPKKILEIGGGFGGFCKIFSTIYNFDEYIMIDLPEPIALCKKYLKHFPELYSKIRFITTEELKNIEPIKDVDLFIAAASLAECDKETQNYYIDNFLLDSKYGYIIYNTSNIRKELYVDLVSKVVLTFNVKHDSFAYVDMLLLENSKK